MDENHIKTKIERFRKITIDEVQDNFQDYIALDMVDAGEANYLIDDLSWYLYWLDVVKEITDFMNYLIVEHHAGKKHYRDYLLECIKFRQIVDKELMNNPHFNSEEVAVEMGGEIYSPKTESVEQDFIHILGDDSKREMLIGNLFKELNVKGFIDVAFDEFAKHFLSSTDETPKIRWYGTEVQITSLFLNLVYQGIIDRSYEYRIPSTIPKHFINKKGNEFNDRQLRVSLSRVRGGDVDHLIAEIVELVKGVNQN